MPLILAAQGPHAITVPSISAQETTGHILELPPLRDIDDNEGFYWGASGVVRSSLWGTVLYRSTDGGATYSALDNTGTFTTLGKTTTALAPYGRPSWDTTNTVSVQLASGSLEAVDALTALNGANLACIGGEIIRFCGARFDAVSGTWVLSTLLRGLLGTDVNESHGPGEDFTLLDLDTVDTVVFDGACVGLPWKYGFLNGAGNLDLPLTGRRIQPNPASHAAVVRDPISGDATISWVPRRRLRYELQDGLDPGVDEPVEDYAVDILLGVTVVRTITSWTGSTAVVGGRSGVDTGWRTVSYSAADQVADGITGDFEAIIYQLSERVGRGVGCSVRTDDFTWNTQGFAAATAGDAAAVSSLTWSSSISESGVATDSPRGMSEVSEAAAADTSLTATLSWSASLSEAATAEDMVDWRGDIFETAFATATVSATISGIWNRTVTAVASATAAQDVARTWNKSLTAAATATAIVTSSIPTTWSVGVSEAGAAADTPNGTF
jgi:hypothetical protein